MRRLALSIAFFAGASGCSRSAVLVPGDDDTMGEGPSTAGADTGDGEPMPRFDLALDLPAAPPSCESLGGEFGIVDGPRLLLPAAAMGRTSLGVAALPESRLLTFVEPTRAGMLDVLAVAFDQAGANGVPAPIWTIPHPLPALTIGTDAGALLVACQSPPSWAFVDAQGRPVGADLISAASSGCIAAAAAAVPSGAIVGWLDGCPGGTCMRIVASSVDAIGAEPGDPNDTIQLALRLVAAAASETAMFATTTTEYFDDGLSRTIVAAQLVDHDATPLFPLFRIEVTPPLDEGLLDRPIGLAATEDDGYLLVLARWGAGPGRLRFDSHGTPLGDVTEVTPPANVPAGSAYRVAIAIARRPGGFVLLGDGSDPPGLQVTVLDAQAEARSSILVPDAPSMPVWAEDGERVLVAWEAEGVQLLELGCVR